MSDRIKIPARRQGKSDFSRMMTEKVLDAGGTVAMFENNKMTVRGAATAKDITPKPCRQLPLEFQCTCGKKHTIIVPCRTVLCSTCGTAIKVSTMEVETIEHHPTPVKNPVSDSAQ